MKQEIMKYRYLYFSQYYNIYNKQEMQDFLKISSATYYRYRNIYLRNIIENEGKEIYSHIDNNGNIIMNGLEFTGVLTKTDSSVDKINYVINENGNKNIK